MFGRRHAETCMTVSVPFSTAEPYSVYLLSFYNLPFPSISAFFVRSYTSLKRKKKFIFRDDGELGGGCSMRRDRSRTKARYLISSFAPSALFPPPGVSSLGAVLFSPFRPSQL